MLTDLEAENFDLLLKAGALDEALDLLKGASHKYLRRIPTGRADRPYRYVYSAASVKDALPGTTPTVGEKVKVKDGEQAGHYEVHHVADDGTVHLKHDETGREMRVHKTELRDLYLREHWGAIGEHGARLKQVHEQALKTGTKTQQRKAWEAMTRHGAQFSDYNPAIPYRHIEAARQAHDAALTAGKSDDEAVEAARKAVYKLSRSKAAASNAAKHVYESRLDVQDKREKEKTAKDAEMEYHARVKQIETARAAGDLKGAADHARAASAEAKKFGRQDIAQRLDDHAASLEQQHMERDAAAKGTKLPAIAGLDPNDYFDARKINDIHQYARELAQGKSPLGEGITREQQESLLASALARTHHRYASGKRDERDGTYPASDAAKKLAAKLIEHHAPASKTKEAANILTESNAEFGKRAKAAVDALNAGPKQRSLKERVDDLRAGKSTLGALHNMVVDGFGDHEAARALLGERAGEATESAKRVSLMAEKSGGAGAHELAMKMHQIAATAHGSGSMAEGHLEAAAHHDGEAKRLKGGGDNFNAWQRKKGYAETENIDGAEVVKQPSKTQQATEALKPASKYGGYDAEMKAINEANEASSKANSGMGGVQAHNDAAQAHMKVARMFGSTHLGADHPVAKQHTAKAEAHEKAAADIYRRAASHAADASKEAAKDGSPSAHSRAVHAHETAARVAADGNNIQARSMHLLEASRHTTAAGVAARGEDAKADAARKTAKKEAKSKTKAATEALSPVGKIATATGLGEAKQNYFNEKAKAAVEASKAAEESGSHWPAVRAHREAAEAASLAGLEPLNHLSAAADHADKMTENDHAQAAGYYRGRGDIKRARLHSDAHEAAAEARKTREFEAIRREGRERLAAAEKVGPGLYREKTSTGSGIGGYGFLVADKDGNLSSQHLDEARARKAAAAIHGEAAAAKPTAEPESKRKPGKRSKTADATAQLEDKSPFAKMTAKETQAKLLDTPAGLESPPDHFEHGDDLKGIPDATSSSSNDMRWSHARHAEAADKLTTKAKDPRLSTAEANYYDHLAQFHTSMAEYKKNDDKGSTPAIRHRKEAVDALTAARSYSGMVDHEAKGEKEERRLRAHDADGSTIEVGATIATADGLVLRHAGEGRLSPVHVPEDQDEIPPTIDDLLGQQRGGHNVRIAQPRDERTMDLFRRSEGAMGTKDAIDLLKSTGEGSRGGHVIGHTRSGKPIYDSAGHADLSSYSKEDHEDAVTKIGRVEYENWIDGETDMDGGYRTMSAAHAAAGYHEAMAGHHAAAGNHDKAVHHRQVAANIMHQTAYTLGTHEAHKAASNYFKTSGHEGEQDEHDEAIKEIKAGRSAPKSFEDLLKRKREDGVQKSERPGWIANDRDDERYGTINRLHEVKKSVLVIGEPDAAPVDNAPALKRVAAVVADVLRKSYATELSKLEAANPAFQHVVERRMATEKPSVDPSLLNIGAPNRDDVVALAVRRLKTEAAADPLLARGLAITGVTPKHVSAVFDSMHLTPDRIRTGR